MGEILRYIFINSKLSGVAGVTIKGSNVMKAMKIPTKSFKSCYKSFHKHPIFGLSLALLLALANTRLKVAMKLLTILGSNALIIAKPREFSNKFRFGLQKFLAFSY